MKHEREEHTEAASQHKEEMQRLKSQMKELKEQLIHAEDKRARAEDMMEPIGLVKQRLDGTLEKAQEEAQVKTNQLQQYKKQVDALKKEVYRLLLSILGVMIVTPIRNDRGRFRSPHVLGRLVPNCLPTLKKAEMRPWEDQTNVAHH